jgi:hypothetical protein
MKKLRFWIPTMIGILATPIFLFLVLNSTRAGHGSYLSFLVFYPMSFLSLLLQTVKPDDAFMTTIIDNASVALAIGFALIQFPLYGFVISYAGTRRDSNLWATCRVVVCVHIVVSLVMPPYAAIAGK